MIIVVWFSIQNSKFCSEIQMIELLLFWSCTQTCGVIFLNFLISRPSWFQPLQSVAMTRQPKPFAWEGTGENSYTSDYKHLKDTTVIKADQCGFVKSSHMSLVPFLSRVSMPNGQGRNRRYDMYILTLVKLVAQFLHFHIQIWKIWLKWFYQGFAFKKGKVLTNCEALQKSLSF